MKLTTSLLMIFIWLDSVAVADGPLHQTFYGTSRGPAKTFFDAHGKYIGQVPIYPPALELHQADGLSRMLPYPSQPLPDSHGDARRQKSDAAHRP